MGPLCHSLRRGLLFITTLMVYALSSRLFYATCQPLLRVLGDLR